MRPNRRTDRHDEAHSHFSQFCERTKNDSEDQVQKDLQVQPNTGG